jgi:anti-sigma regulatory factor (Ser/Thr protein kinase)
MAPAPDVRLTHRLCHDAFQLPAEDARVGEARRRVRAILRGWGVDHRGDDMVLIVSELFTNAIRYSGGDRIDVALWTAENLLYVEVTDRGPTGGDAPTPQEAGVDDECGRGLMLVEHLAVRWGSGSNRPGGGGHAVWAALALG